MKRRTRRPLASEDRCQLCGGVLVAVGTLPPRDWPYLEMPAYVCNICEQPFWWRGTPLKLVGLKGA